MLAGVVKRQMKELLQARTYRFAGPVPLGGYCPDAGLATAAGRNAEPFRSQPGGLEESKACPATGWRFMPQWLLLRLHGELVGGDTRAGSPKIPLFGDATGPLASTCK